MKVSLITCTGDRREAWELCREWVNRQTAKPDQWIVVDDGVERSVSMCGQVEDSWRQDQAHQIAIMPSPMPGKNSLLRNLRLALTDVTGDLALFIEDDDYYPPNYIEEMIKLFERSNRPAIFGARKRAYYHLPTRRYRYFENLKFTSLAQTGISREGLETVAMPLADSYDGNHFDVELWKRFKKAKDFALVPTIGARVIGFKGMPGRGGIGVGHRPDGNWSKDRYGEVLKKLVGADAIHYEKFLGAS